MPALMQDLWLIPTLYERNRVIDTYNELEDKCIIELECTPFKFYGKVSPQLLIHEGYSEFIVYLFSHILKGGWIEYHNTVARQEGKVEFHFCFENTPESVRTEKFIPWLQKKEKSRYKNLVSRLKRVLISDRFPENNLDLLIVEDVFAIPPEELYKCSGIGKESILKLKDHFMDIGMDWFHFHKFKPVRKDFTDVGRGW